MQATTVKLTNRFGEKGGEWFVDPNEWPDSPKARNIIKTYLECAEGEPNRDWHLEFRGTQTGWHRSDTLMCESLKQAAEREVERLLGLGWKKEDFAKALRELLSGA